MQLDQQLLVYSSHLNCFSLFHQFVPRFQHFLVQASGSQLPNCVPKHVVVLHVNILIQLRTVADENRAVEQVLLRLLHHVVITMTELAPDIW